MMYGQQMGVKQATPHIVFAAVLDLLVQQDQQCKNHIFAITFRSTRITSRCVAAHVATGPESDACRPESGGKEALLALFILLHEEIKQCCGVGPFLAEPQYTATAGAIVNSKPD